MAVAIELKNLSKTFEHGTKSSLQAVNSLNISIPEGQIFGFLGPNGAGKTTLIKMLCGLITQTQGTISLNGYDVLCNRHKAMQQIGAVLEGARNIYWQLSSWENLLYYGRLKGYFGKKLYNRATVLLQDLDVWDRRHERVGEFSRGTQQKVAIACALIADPSIVLFDEPMLGLDVQAARTIRHWIIDLAQHHGKTIILTTHQLDIAQQLCERVAIMDKGTILIEKPIQDLLNIFRQESYHIKIAGLLDKEQLEFFTMFSVSTQEDKTILSGTLSHPNELYCIIDTIKSKGLSLLSASKITNNLEDVFIQLMNRT